MIISVLTKSKNINHLNPLYKISYVESLKTSQFICRSKKGLGNNCRKTNSFINETLELKEIVHNRI